MVDDRLDSEIIPEVYKDALHESYSHNQTCRSMRSLAETIQHLQHGVNNVSNTPERGNVPAKYREKLRFTALKQARDIANNGIARWSVPSGEPRDLKCATAFAGLPMILINITPARPEPYTISTRRCAWSRTKGIPQTSDARLVVN